MWAAAVVTRLRRAGSDEVRQLRWFVFAVAVSLLLLLVGQVVWSTPLLGLLTLPLVPLAAGVAIVRYRLYDIDPVINKTLVGGAMVLLIFVGYVAVVVGVGALLPVSDRVLALAATAMVAVVFEPVRRRAQAVADRLVYGRTSDAVRDAVASLRAAGRATTRDCSKASPPRSPAASVPPRSWSGSVMRSAWRRSPRGRRDPRAGPRSLAELGSRRELVRPVWHDGIVQGALVLHQGAG